MSTAYRRRRSRPVRPPEIAFLTTIAVVSLFALYSFGKNHVGYEYHDATQAALALRALEDEPDQECRLVHQMKDLSKQCAFIRRNCPDEEAGLISYLQLYYCTLANAKPIAFTILVLWMSVLFSTIGIAASDFLCINLSTIAAVLGMSESLTGVTFLAFGNGSPDVFSTFAAMSSNSGSLAVGELMGAAGFITAVVAGSMAIVKPFQVAKKSFVRDVGFFAVAASFSLVFLRDGSLRLWECVSMVAFYIFYVVFVVVWHWYLGRQRRIRLAETAARLHHHIPDQQELETPHIHFDEEATPASERSPLMRMQSDASVPSLRTPSTPAWLVQTEDDDDETRDRYLAELQSNMRLNRVPRRDRRNTLTPIRPSLIGAIEFRSVLHALEKRSTNSRPIGLRGYSDDNFRDCQPDYSVSQPHLAVTAPEDPRPSVSTISGRNRAVSANDAAGLRIDADLLSPFNATPETVIYSPGGRQSSTSSHRRTQTDNPRSDFLSPSYSSDVMQSPSAMTMSSGAPSPRFTYAEHNGMLAPPTTGSGTFHSPDYQDNDGSRSVSPMVSPNMDIPILQLPDPEHRKPPLTNQFASPTRSPVSSRPPSIRLPPPSMSPESAPAITLTGDEEGFSNEMRRYRWWPYKYMPPPQVILSTLFPTVYAWREKGIVGKVVGLLTAPAVFLLTITLPVVEPPEEQDSLEEDIPVAMSPETGRRHTLVDIASQLAEENFGKMSTNHPHSGTVTRSNTDLSKFNGTDEENNSQPRSWNRWLAIVQLFTAPIFVALIVYANLDDGHSVRELVLLILGCLVFSLIGLLGVLATTSPDREPKGRPIMCFLGFAVAIAWISTIANEVVGVLKALGVIVGMSDAILGLTIFAVGNSLGDLVADITVAKLGYPVMALSACFGGPMLNILLGIGIGGMYMTIHKGQTHHHKHPNKPIHYQPYELQISTTLIVSGITLLVTLCGLLIFVPLNGWRMDRKIGIGLIAVWLLSTTGNVICEVLGLGNEGHTTAS